MHPSKEEVMLTFMAALCTKEYFIPEATAEQAKLLTDYYFRAIESGEKE